ncbi:MULTISPECIES: apolipoprotein acyltransferase [unclassified Roseivivax]|uniref:apolipoprotein acyltransferase n=1 Tax=Roseivivax sp. GX 12232 TaxID=2900547 RepID=UPI001E6378F8|nr:apolipoprotein acyltransferase [Roseivivax sp. GX 12232]MCE0504242.1 apolipoprotein acyltransferase [Roseivivax sp. GX 12232]
MIVIIAALLGALIGGLTARRRKGDRFDILQYSAIYAIAFALLGLIGTIALENILV